MKVFWQQCEGQVIDGFPLRQYLGGDEHHGVFLTERGGEKPRKAAIKIAQADPDSAERELQRWRLAAELSHPNLMRLLERGTGQLNNVPLSYVVMEYADEDLSQVIPERPLTVEEAKEALKPALDALAYLHTKGFVHARLKPSNFMAVDGRLKLSSDGITKAGTTLTPSDDVWSLGMTLVEVLTQRRPVLTASGTGEAALPETLPVEFRDLVRHMLQRDPQRRWTIAEIQNPSQRREPVQPAPQPRRSYAALAGTALILLLLVLLAGTLLFRHREASAVVTTPTVQPQPAPAKPVQTQPAPVKPPAEAPEPKPSPTPRAGKEIIQEVIPEVPSRARNTITGKVTVKVRVDVDPAGSVSDATFESRGPSEYFGGLALKAARRWKFAAGEAPRAWILRFEFRRAGTKVAAAKANLRN